MKGQIKIRIIKNESAFDFKIGQIVFTDISTATLLINDGIAEKIDEEREREAKWLSDKQTLDGGFLKIPKDEKGFYRYITKQDCLIANVSIENADRWVKEKNKQIQKNDNQITKDASKRKKVEEELTKIAGITKEDYKDNWVKYLLSQEKPDFKSLGVGIHEIEGKEVFYFGVKIYNNSFGMDSIITSDRKVYLNSYNPKTEEGNNQIILLGIKYKFPFLDSVLDYTWSNNSSQFSVNSFLYGEPKNITLKECFQETYENNKSYMDYPEDIINISIACDILSSYFLPIFEAKGRAFFNAEKGSGKTRQSTLYDLQMFNPVMSADMTGASYFRIIESTSASIIIDDFDSIDEEKKQSQIQVMRAGYKKGQKAVRCADTGGKAPQSFSIFNSMIINNVGGLDEITQDRCNTYYLIKSNNKEKSDKKLDDKNISWKIQRDKKFYCALLNWELVRKTYNELQIENVSGRDLERIAPILTIGKIVLNENDYNRLLKYEIERISDYKTRDVSEDWLFLAIQFVVKVIKAQNFRSAEIQLNEIVEAIINIQPYERDYKKTKQHMSSYIGKVLKNTPLFRSGKVHGGYVKYFFDPVNVLKFIEIRNFTEYFDTEDLKLLGRNTNQPIQSIQSNQPLQSNQPIQNNDNTNNNIINNDNNGETGETGEGGYVKKWDKGTNFEKEKQPKNDKQ